MLIHRTDGAEDGESKGGDTGSFEANKAVVRRLFKAENAGTVALYDKGMAADYVDKAVQVPRLKECQHMHAKTGDA